MKRFAELCRLQDRAEPGSEVAALLSSYLSSCNSEDAAWSIYLLVPQSRNRYLSTQRLKKACLEVTGIPDWLYSECMDETGDASETIALLLPNPDDREPEGAPLAVWMNERLPTLTSGPIDDALIRLKEFWFQVDSDSRMTLNKLITGTRPAKVSVQDLARGLSALCGTISPVLEARLSSPFSPTPEWYGLLKSPATLEELAEANRRLVSPSEKQEFTAVLMYAERGSSGDLVLFTFGVWHEKILVSTAKVPWVRDREVALAIEAFVRENTLEKRGPIRVVPPKVVVRLEFEGVIIAPKRKAGIELLQPTVAEWLIDADPIEASTLQWLKGLIAG